MWPSPQFPADLVTFTEETLNGKLHFLCSASFANYVVMGSRTSDIVPLLSKGCLDIQATLECRFTLNGVRGMIRTYS